MSIDLQQFCSTDIFRPNLVEPFSSEKFIYATNGHVFVRVPRCPEITRAAPVNVSFIEKLIDGFSGRWTPSADFELPPLNYPNRAKCPECYGHGTEHGCPYCQCECSECHGTGFVGARAPSFGILGKIINADYLKMVFALPNAEIGTDGADKDMLFFRFDGGDGAIMRRFTESESGHAEAITKRDAE